MSNVRITYADLVTIANSGHDRFVPALTRDETRELVTSIREHFAVERRERDEYWRRRQDNWRASSERTLAAANAKLGRVRCIAYESAGIVAEAIRRALADQPEAPKEQAAVDWFGLYNREHSTNADLERDLAAAKAKIADLEAELHEVRVLGTEQAKLRRMSEADADAAMSAWVESREKNAAEFSAELAAAKAKIAELESGPCGCNAVGRVVTVCDAHRERDAAKARIAELEDKLQMADCAEVAANARADAAERDVAGLREQLKLVDGRTAESFRTERDQLAARVTKLEQSEAAVLRVTATRVKDAEQRIMACKDHLAEALYHRDNDPAHELRKALEILRGKLGGPEHVDSRCTPEERAELDALDAIPDSELSSSGNWYGWAKPIGVAVLANRAAKAKREAK